MLNRIRVRMTKSAPPMGSHGEFTCWRRLARRRWEICTILGNPVDFEDIFRMIRAIIVFIEDNPQLITFPILSTCGDQRAWFAPHIVLNYNSIPPPYYTLSFIEIRCLVKPSILYLMTGNSFVEQRQRRTGDCLEPRTTKTLGCASLIRLVEVILKSLNVSDTPG